MPPPNFKSFNKALNNKILFPFPLAVMKKNVKNTFRLDQKTLYIKEYQTNQKNCFWLARNTVSTTGVKTLFLKVRLHALIMVSTSKNLKMLFHLDRKRFYSFYFCWWKPLLKLGRIQFLKNNLLPGNEKQGESNIKN